MAERFPATAPLSKVKRVIAQERRAKVPGAVRTEVARVEQNDVTAPGLERSPASDRLAEQSREQLGERNENDGAGEPAHDTPATDHGAATKRTTRKEVGQLTAATRALDLRHERFGRRRSVMGAPVAAPIIP
jgi:hypothetical protein